MVVYKVILNKNEIIFISNADREMVSYLFKIYKSEALSGNINFYFKRTGYTFREFKLPETNLRKKIYFKPKINFTIEI